MTTEMTKGDITEHLVRAGWSLDKDGNLTKQGTKRMFRITFKDEVVRIEVQVERGAAPIQTPSNKWVRIGGAAYNKIVLHDDGQLQIGTDFFKVQ